MNRPEPGGEKEPNETRAGSGLIAYSDGGELAEVLTRNVSWSPDRPEADGFELTSTRAEVETGSPADRATENVGAAFGGDPIVNDPGGLTITGETDVRAACSMSGEFA